MSHFRRIWWTPDLPPHSNVMELGPGSSRAFARLCAAKGWCWHGRGSVNEPAESMPFDGQYQAIFAWQVLEHTIDPDLVLEKARKALTPGGYLVLSVPNTRSFEQRWFGKKWDGWTGGDEDMQAMNGPHRHFWNAHSLTALLEAHGFVVESVLYQRILKGFKLPTIVELIAGTILAALGISSRMTLVARA